MKPMHSVRLRSFGELLKSQRRNLFFALLLVAVSGGAASAGETPDETKTLEERVQELDQKVRIMERLKELEQEKAAESKKDAATAGIGKDGFFLKSADGNFLLKIRGYLHFDGRFYRGDDQKKVSDTFVLRRVRPIFEGTVAKNFEFRIMPDFGAGTTVLQDAWIEVRFAPQLRLRAGKYKVPFGLERLQSATDTLFVERALPTNLVPNRDLGIQVHGEIAQGALAYAAGVFNGVTDAGSSDIDINDSKEAAARIFVLPFKRATCDQTLCDMINGIGIGISATIGNNRGTTAATSLGTFKTAGQQTFFSYRSDGTLAGTVVADGRHARLSPQAYWYFSRIGVLAEAVSSTQEIDRNATSHNIQAKAWQGSASFLLTNDKASWKSVSPKKPFDPKEHTWGALDIVARYGRLRVDESAFPVFANPASSASAATEFAGGVNWYLNGNFRIELDYSRTSFKGGAATGDRPSERVLLSRFQLSF